MLIGGLDTSPQLRLLYVTRPALLKYRFQLPGFELPQAVRLAQLEFDNRLTEVRHDTRALNHFGGL
jgi:hypothetical protein